jgi:hypothetical protein
MKEAIKKILRQPIEVCSKGTGEFISEEQIVMMTSEIAALIEPPPELDIARLKEILKGSKVRVICEGLMSGIITMLGFMDEESIGVVAKGIAELYPEKPDESNVQKMHNSIHACNPIQEAQDAK